jgi:hypothetical protein
LYDDIESKDLVESAIDGSVTLFCICNIFGIPYCFFSNPLVHHVEQSVEEDDDTTVFLLGIAVDHHCGQYPAAAAMETMAASTSATGSLPVPDMNSEKEGPNGLAAV